MQYDHYKETCQLNREAEDKRNRLMLKSIIVLAIFVLLCLDKLSALIIINGLSKSQFGNSFPISLMVLSFLCLLVFSYYYVSYIQKCIYIENQYLYIAKLERLLSEQPESAISIEREYKEYNSSQPKLLKFIGWFYKYALSGCILGIAIYVLIICYEDSIFYYLSILLVLQLFLITIGYFKFHRMIEKKYTN